MNQEDSTIPERARIINEELMPHWKVLEVGCKDGRLTNRIWNVKWIVGLDIDEKVIRKAKKYENSFRKFMVGDAYELPFKDGSFDAVIAGDIIEHLQDGNKMLSEAHRVLRGCGKLIISCPYHGTIKNILISLFNFEGHFNTEADHIRFYSIKSLTKIIEKNNFVIIRRYFIGRVCYIWRNMMFVAVRQ